jgi:hypothetical protein
MLTMRELTGEGFGPKVRAWNSTERLEQWREDWGQAVNRDLERHGHEARVDHRSLADQGIDREPEPKQGPIATEMERAGRPSHAGDDRRAAQARNEERAAIEAELPALTAQLIDLEQERERRREHESEPAPPRHLGPDEPFAEPSPLRVAPDQEPAPPARDYVESPPLTGGDSIVCLGFDMFSEFIHEGISLAQAVGDEVGFVVREIGRSGPQSLEDFATAEILRRSAEPPPREITPAEYATSTEARRAYHDQQAAERAAAAARSEALDQLRDEIKGSRSLDPAAIRNLSTDDLVNIKSKGDDGLRAIIEDHERDQKRQREDVGRERER